MHWRFSFGVGPTKSATWSLFLCAAALTAVYILAAFPCFWSSSTSTSLSNPFLAPSRRLRLFLAAIVSSTRPVLGALVKVSLSPYRRLFSSPMFSPARHVVSSSSVMILLPTSSSTSLRRWCRHLLGYPALLPLQQCTGNLVLVMHRALPSGRAFSLFGRLCAVDHASPRPSGHCQYLPALFRRAKYKWSYWPHPGHVGVSPGSPPSSLHRWFSQEVSPRLDRDLRHRLSAMVSDLHGVPVDVFSDNFLPVRENPGAMTTPPQAQEFPLVTSRAPPPVPFAMTRTAPLYITFPLALYHHNARAAWAHSCGISLPEAPALAQHRSSIPPSR